MMLRYFPLVLVGLILAADGYLHGLWTERWASSAELNAAVARLDDVPLTVGEWQGQKLDDLAARAVEQAGFAGYLHRRYENRRTRAVVNVLLACGRCGPISVHTPDVCYRGSGYDALGAQVKHQEGEGTAEFWKVRMVKSSAASRTELRIFWSWSAAGPWQAPENPRVHFVGAPSLFKLYVIEEVMADRDDGDQRCQEFLGQFLPELDKALYRKS